MCVRSGLVLAWPQAAVARSQTRSAVSASTRQSCSHWATPRLEPQLLRLTDGQTDSRVSTSNKQGTLQTAKIINNKHIQQTSENDKANKNKTLRHHIYDRRTKPDKHSLQEAPHFPSIHSYEEAKIRTNESAIIL